VWMTEWVRLREARKREIGLKKQAADARLRQRAEAQRLELEKSKQESEEAERPYRIRVETLTKLRDEATQQAKWKYGYPYGAHEAWQVRAETAMEEILGEFHPLINKVNQLWSYKLPDDPGTIVTWENQTWREAEGVLNAAIESHNFMNIKVQDSTIANTLDPDLMARVDHVFRVEDWTAVASLAATFVEDRFRIWAGLNQNFFGVRLMTKVLHPESGVFPLGIAEAEREGWHQLGRGFVSACSNVDRHRIQSRDDLRATLWAFLARRACYSRKFVTSTAIALRMSSLGLSSNPRMPGNDAVRGRGWLDPSWISGQIALIWQESLEVDAARRPYEIYQHACDRLTNDASALDRVDAITTLKRAVTQRARVLTEAYGLDALPLRDKPRDHLKLLAYLGIVRPLMLRRLIDIRNFVEHEDRSPPDIDDCLAFADFVWYFLRSTDLLVHRRIAEIEYGFTFGETGEGHITVTYGERHRGVLSFMASHQSVRFSDEPKSDWIEFRPFTQKERIMKPPLNHLKGSLSVRKNRSS
jgi:Protein of unknown function (Hypoth_ymh)